MRPFFPTVQDFAAATAPHFAFLVDDFGFVGPSIEEQTDEMYDVAYYGSTTAVLLNWDTTGLVLRVQPGAATPPTGRSILTISTGSRSTRSSRRAAAQTAG